MAKRILRTSVTWTDPNKTPAQRYPLHVSYPTLPDGEMKRYEVAMKPGALFFLKADVQTINHADSWMYPHPMVGLYYPPWGVTEDKYAMCVGVIGEPAVYIGSVRVNEMQHRNGSDINKVLRTLYHTFFIRDGIYIVPDLNYVTPGETV